MILIKTIIIPFEQKEEISTHTILSKVYSQLRGPRCGAARGIKLPVYHNSYRTVHNYVAKETII